MGASRLSNLFAVRGLLDYPQPNSPSFDILLRQCISEERSILNATNNTGKPWAVNQFVLNYIPGQNDYSINVSDWGKVLYCVRNTTNPYIPFLPVPFDDITDMQYGTLMSYFYGNGWGQSFGLSETIERIAFYREGVTNPIFRCRIEPAPQQSWTYYLNYIPGYLGQDDPLETQMQMSEHVELLRLRVAAAMLPYAKWSDDEAKNLARRKELKESFDYQLNRPQGKEKEFADYIRNFNRNNSVTVDDWNFGS